MLCRPNTGVYATARRGFETCCVADKEHAVAVCPGHDTERDDSTDEVGAASAIPCDESIEMLLCMFLCAEADACPGRRDRDRPPDEVGRGIGMQLHVAGVNPARHLGLHPAEVDLRAPEPSIRAMDLGPSAAMTSRKGISSRPRMPRVRRVEPCMPDTLVLRRNSAPASAALCAISRSRRHRSTTWAFVTPASKRSSPPRSETILAPLTSFWIDSPETPHSSNADVERSPAHCTG